MTLDMVYRQLGNFRFNSILKCKWPKDKSHVHLFSLHDDQSEFPFSSAETGIVESSSFPSVVPAAAMLFCVHFTFLTTV